MAEKSISIKQFYLETRERLNLRLMNGESGFFRQIVNLDIHRPGLALAGFLELFTYDRIQLLGNTEIRYLNSISSERRSEAIEPAVGGLLSSNRFAPENQKLLGPQFVL